MQHIVAPIRRVRWPEVWSVQRDHWAEICRSDALLEMSCVPAMCIGSVQEIEVAPHQLTQGRSTGFGAVGWEAYVERMRRTMMLRNLNSIPDPLKRRFSRRRKEKIREKNTCFPPLQWSLNGPSYGPSSCSTTAKLRAIFGLTSFLFILRIGR